MPSPVSNTQDTVTFSKAGFERLLAYTTVSGGNYRIASENAKALDGLSRSYNHLIEAGRLQNQFTQIREEQLQRARRDQFTSTWFYRGVIALIGLGSL